MRKISILAASALTLTGIMGMPMMAQAQTAPCGQGQVKVITANANNNSCNTQGIKDQLSQYGINLDDVLKSNGVSINDCNNKSNNNAGKDCRTDNSCNTDKTCDDKNNCNTDTPVTPETPAKEETPAADTPAADTPAAETPKAETPKAETPKAEEQNTELSFQEQVVKLVNEERAKAGLSSLTLDTSVQSAAQVRAQESATSFSHTRPSGKSFSTALTEAGVKFKGSGENIAWGQKTPEEVMKGWMNSAGHKANILNPNYTKIGVGYYQNAKGVNYWSQLFIY